MSSSPTPPPTNETLEQRVAKLETTVAQQQRLLWGLLEAGGMAVCVAPLAIVIVKLPRPDSLPWKVFFDFTHVAISAVLVFAGLRLSTRLLGDMVRRRRFHYVLAGGAAFGAGVGLEVLQMVGPGDASLGDAIRDLLGVGVGLCIALSLDPAWPRSLLRSWAPRVAAIGLLGLSFVPAARTVWRKLEQQSQFPGLANFETELERRFVEAADGAELQLVAPPPAFSTAQGKRVARVRFGSGGYPNLEVTSVGGDWSRYRSLVFEAFSPAAGTARLELRIHDARHNNEYGDRFNTELLVQPGLNTLVVPIEQVRSGPEDRELRLDAVEAIVLFMDSPEAPITLYFDAFRLE